MSSNRGTVAGSIVALVSAAIGLAVAFGVNVTAAERDAVISFVTAAIAVAPLVGAAFDHTRASSSARVHAAAIVAGTDVVGRVNAATGTSPAAGGAAGGAP